jgi:hypothetical protein
LKIKILKGTAYIFLFILSTCTFYTHLPGISTNDWEKDELKGRVNEFIEKNYSIEYPSSAPIKKLIRTKIKKYDKTGKNIEDQEYRSPTFFNKYIHRFNNIGSRSINMKYIPVRGIKKIINDKQIAVIITNMGETSLNSKDIYKYDKKGNLVEWCSYKSESLLFSKYTYKYDNKGNLIEDNFYNMQGMLKWKNLYRYDKKGNMDKKTVYKYDSVFSEYTFKYDSMGNMIQESQYMMKKIDDEEKMLLTWFNEYEYKYWKNDK